MIDFDKRILKGGMVMLEFIKLVKRKRLRVVCKMNL